MVRVAGVVALALVLQTALGVSDHLRNGFHARSGDIVITHATPVKGDALLIAVDSMQEDLTSKKAGSNMPQELRETDVASLASHAIGSLPMSADVPAQAGAFSSTVLRKPKANLMILVPGVGQISAQELAMSHIQELRQEHSSFTVANTFEPRNPLSQLTTLVTGELPSMHGIVGRQWVDRSSKKGFHAFDKMGSHSAVPTIADVVSDTFANPLVVSLSGCAKFAAAAAPHAKSASNSFVFSVNTEEEQLNNAANNDAQPLTKASIAEFIASESTRSVLGLFRRDGGVLTVTGNIITVQPFAGASDADTVTFDLAQKADFKLFAEFVAVQRLIDNLQNGELSSFVNDQSPDMFTLTLMGFQKMSNVYGSDSAKTVTAARLIDSAVAQTIKLFSTVYRSRLATEVMLMGSPAKVDDVRVKKALADVVGEELHDAIDMEATYPSFYVEESLPHTEIEALCSRVSSAATEHGLKAECISDLVRPMLLQTKAQNKDDGDGDDAEYTQAQIANYQINLWVTVLLLLLIYAGLYPLVYLDVSGGTFSSFLFAKKYC